MKTALYGRIVFGASAVLAGVVELIWHDSDTWQHLHPFGLTGAIVAWCLTIAQVGGGIGIIFPSMARPASIANGAVYVLFSLSNIPAMIAKPDDWVQYVDFFEKFSIVCGAIAVYAATQANESQPAALRQFARIGLGVCVASFAWAQVVYLQYTASLVPAWIPPNQMFWTILTTIAFALAAIAILINVQAKLAIRLMALMLTLFGILVWVPHIVADPKNLSNWNEIASNYLMTAASWMVGELL